jgi:hypothetical protein
MAAFIPLILLIIMFPPTHKGAPLVEPLPAIWGTAVAWQLNDISSCRNNAVQDIAVVVAELLQST